MMGFCMAWIILGLIGFFLATIFSFEEHSFNLLGVALTCLLMVVMTIFTMVATYDHIINTKFNCVTNNNIMTCVEKVEKKK